MTLLAPPADGGHRPGSRPEPATVVVAAHQAAVTLNRCLDAVLAQRPAPAQVVLVDDGSTDRTADVLAEYADRICAIRLPHNVGEASAKNAGVAAARTPLVALVDADDVVLPGWLAAVTEALAERPDLDVVTADAWVIDRGRTRRRAYAHGPGTGIVFPVEDQRRAILRSNFVLGFAAFRRETFLASGGFDSRVRVASDWSAWAGMVLAGCRVGLVDLPLAEYHRVEGSLSSDPLQVLRARVDVLTRLTQHPHLERPDRGVLRDSLADHRAALDLGEARHALRTGAADARSRALGVARSTRHRLPTRAKAAVTAAMPLPVARWLVSNVSTSVRADVAG